MLDMFKELTASQYGAALGMLKTCIEKCPDDSWDEPVANLKFCQAAFHALFFTDLYLGCDVESLRSQPFHLDHAEFFGDYEELEDRPQVSLYKKVPIMEYVRHCREKAAQVVAAETVETLCARSGFDWLALARAELHVSNIRHIQHHAAQLSLRLRLENGEGIPWIKSGRHAN